MRATLARRVLGIVGAAMALAGIVAYALGGGLLEKVTRLAADTQVTAALEEGRDGLVGWNKERELWAARVIDACVESPDWPRCLPREATAAAVAGQTTATGWEDDAHYLVNRPSGGGTYRVTITWESLRPHYEHLAAALTRRAHLDTVLPSLAKSFQLIFALALALAGGCGLLVLWLLTRGIARRLGALSEYARTLASGQLLAAPAATLTRDELGLLARSMESMATSLSEATQKLVFAGKMESWQTAAHKVAHEIKNPLTPIGLVSEQLQRCRNRVPPDVATTLAEASRVLTEETAALARMVREFSDFARLPTPRREPCDLAALIDDFIRRTRETTGPTLETEPGIAPAPVFADPALLRQVLHNLVNNSVRAKAPAPVRVRFTLTRTSRGYALDVADDGPGVPDALKERLFDAYVTSRSTGDADKGMGLGLAISRKIAHEHGGTLILARSGPNGACFRLELPALPAPTKNLELTP